MPDVVQRDERKVDDHRIRDGLKLFGMQILEVGLLEIRNAGVLA